MSHFPSVIVLLFVHEFGLKLDLSHLIIHFYLIIYLFIYFGGGERGRGQESTFSLLANLINTVKFMFEVMEG